MLTILRYVHEGGSINEEVDALGRYKKMNHDV